MNELANQVATPARKRRSRDQRVKRFRSQLVSAAVAPHLNQKRFAPLVASFARVSILALDVYEFLREKGIVGADGEIRSSVQNFQHLVAAQLKLAVALSLTPAALGKLKGENPEDLAAAMARHVGGEVVSDGEPG